MSLVQIKALGDGVTLEAAEDGRTYRIKGGDDAFTVDMRPGQPVVLTLLETGDVRIRSVHELGTESLEDFDRRVAKRRPR